MTPGTGGNHARRNKPRHPGARGAAAARPNGNLYVLLLQGLRYCRDSGKSPEEFEVTMEGRGYQPSL